MSMKKTFIILGIILLIAAGLRFYRLGDVPVSPDWDEVAIGYNAYSLLRTGQDEYGVRFPVSIRSFGDYKPPLYAYVSVLPVKLFGLTTWSVRLPSAVMGWLAVLGVFFLVREIQFFGIAVTGNQTKAKEHFLHGDTFPLLATFLLAISPWHLQFSRIAFESNLGVTINIWAFIWFFRGLTSKVYLLFSAALFGLGLYAYHTERVFLPLMLILFMIIFRKTLFSRDRIAFLLISLAAGGLIVAPLVLSLTDKTALERLKGTSTFSNQIQLLSRTSAKLEEDRKSGDSIGTVLDNRRFVWMKTIASGYLSHFSIQWLFLNGDNPRHHAPSMGLLYFVELPFLVYGIVTILRKFTSAGKAVIFGWIALAPVAASVTTGLPHAVRTLVFLPVFQIIIAIGALATMDAIWRKLRDRSIVLVWVSCIIVGISSLYNFGYYLNMYYVHQNPETSEDWQYGYKEVVEYTLANKNRYKKIVVSTKLDQPYIFFLFFTKYDPSLYLAGGGSGAIRPGGVRYAFDTYEFREIDWEAESHDGSILYVGAPGEIPQNNATLFTYPNGKLSFVVAQ